MLTAKQINIQIGSSSLAKNIDFELKQGQVTAILGPNGTGKSTLLKALFGDIKLESGKVNYCDNSLTHNSISQWRSQFGYMPQDINLDVNLTAIEVVLLGQLDALSLKVGNDMLHKALGILDQIGLSHLANKDVSKLSGGQRQMILFAQALMREPKIMMLDEPVSALDLHYQHVLLEHLVNQTREREYVTLMVLHDLNLA
ncbi:ABC transporter ATP-binding protein [Vibrio sp. M260118]|uniref:ABC transporter ATP-binding protein n=1 Tax=Vibrio sp. M260118 TaxID=3020896 RepID=UPI002F420682